MYREVIAALNEAGYEAYLVGGSVRDMLLGREIYDYDICTSAFPHTIPGIFPDYKVIETGIKHGTVTLLYKNTPFEITVYRKELGYSDHRHPDTVIFGATLADDLMRRDFTVNAICFDGNEYIDLHGGIEDIKHRVIRAVGDPKKRFEEDALRILRGLRFASTLGFEIEENTLSAMREYADDIKKISAERIFSEFKKAAEGEHFQSVYKKYYDIFAYFIPKASPVKSVFSNGEDAIYSLKALKADKKSIKLAEDYFKYFSCKPIELLRYCGEDNAKYICRKRGDTEDLERVLNQGTPYKLSMLEINGDDVSAVIGDKRRINALLNSLLDEVMAGKTENKREILLQKVVDML